MKDTSSLTSTVDIIHQDGCERSENLGTGKATLFYNLEIHTLVQMNERSPVRHSSHGAV